MEQLQTVEQVPGDAIRAEDLCPMLWSLVEDTAAQGFISPGEWKQHLLSCSSCQVKLLELMKLAVEQMDVDAATRMFLRTVVKKAQQLIRQVGEARAQQQTLIAEQTQ